jgi:predicted DNA-binding transcriptional regulator AlpA
MSDPFTDASADAAAARRYLTGPQVCQRYSISDVGLWRWLRDRELNFPLPAMRVRDRRYWLEDDLVVWERSMIPRGDSEKRREVEPA